MKPVKNEIRQPNPVYRYIYGGGATLISLGAIFNFAAGDNIKAATELAAAIGFGLACYANEQKTEKKAMKPMGLGTGILAATFTAIAMQDQDMGSRVYYGAFAALWTSLTAMCGWGAYKLRNTSDTDPLEGDALKAEDQKSADRPDHDDFRP